MRMAHKVMLACAQHCCPLHEDNHTSSLQAVCSTSRRSTGLPRAPPRQTFGGLGERAGLGRYAGGRPAAGVGGKNCLSRCLRGREPQQPGGRCQCGPCGPALRGRAGRGCASCVVAREWGQPQCACPTGWCTRVY